MSLAKKDVAKEDLNEEEDKEEEEVKQEEPNAPTVPDVISKNLNEEEELNLKQRMKMRLRKLFQH